MKKIIIICLMLTNFSALFCMTHEQVVAETITALSNFSLSDFNIDTPEPSEKPKARSDGADSKEIKDIETTSNDGKKPKLPNPNNFHIIIEDELYRCAQPTPEQLEEYIQKYGIKTIVNLRSTRDEKGEEVAATYGILKPKNYVPYTEDNPVEYNHYHHIPMCCDNLPDAKSLYQLMLIFKSAQRPILIHCEKGVDRTGEACALYLYLIHNKSKKEALEQLSPAFGYKLVLHPGKAFLIHILPDKHEEIWDWIIDAIVFNPESKGCYNPYDRDLAVRIEFLSKYGNEIPPARAFDFDKGMFRPTKEAVEYGQVWLLSGGHEACKQYLEYNNAAKPTITHTE